jgi:hypothetical protein
LADPTVRQRLTDLGQEIPPRDEQTPEALDMHHRSEISEVVADHQGRHQGRMISMKAVCRRARARLRDA